MSEPEETVETVEFVTSELREITTGALYVNVDFNDLVSTFGAAEAFEMVGKLKDLLG